MPDPLLRAIPYPQPTLDSIKEAVLALKAVVELLAGMHGHTNNAGRSARYEELAALILRVDGLLARIVTLELEMDAVQADIVAIQADIVVIQSDIADILVEIANLWAAIGALPTFATTTEVLQGTLTTKMVSPDGLAALWEKGPDITAAATIAIGEGGIFVVTGNTGITDIDFATPKDGREADLVFTGTPLITHSANLVLPGAVNRQIVAGDIARVRQFNGDVMYVTHFRRNDGKALIPPSASDLPFIPLPGTCHNAKIVASRSGNAETWALKTLAGNDPSASDPVIWVGCNGTIALVTSAVSLVASSGSTLGATSGQAFNVHFALVNDSGTFRIAVINPTDANGWTRFSPTGILSATAEGGAGGADTIKTVYSNAAITSKEYAHLGFMSYSLATAGTWNTAPLASGFGPTAPKPGDELQSVYSTDTGNVNVTSGSFVAMTNKNVAITPRLAANLIHVMGTIMITQNGAVELSYSRWHRGTTNNTNPVGAQEWNQADASGGAVRASLSPFAFDKPNTTSSQTYTMQGRRQFGTSTDYSEFYAIAREIMA